MLAFNETFETLRCTEMVIYSPFVGEKGIAAGGSGGTICCGSPTTFEGQGTRLDRVNIISYTTGPGMALQLELPA
jgi:hypothetical protein